MSEKGRNYIKKLGQGARLVKSVAEPVPRSRVCDAAILDSFSFSDSMAGSQPPCPPLVPEKHIVSRDQVSHPLPDSNAENTGSRDWVSTASVPYPPGTSVCGAVSGDSSHTALSPSQGSSVAVASSVLSDSTPLGGGSLINAAASSLPHAGTSGLGLPSYMPTVTSHVMATHSALTQSAGGHYTPAVFGGAPFPIPHSHAMAAHTGFQGHGHPQLYVGPTGLLSSQHFHQAYAPVRHFLPTAPNTALPSTAVPSALAQPFRQEVAAPVAHSLPYRQDGVVVPAPHSLPPLPDEAERDLRPPPPNSVADVGEDSDVKAHSPFSFSDAIARLGNILPEYVSEAQGNTNAGLSASELALGRRTASSYGGLCLLESPMMGRALGDQMSKVRGGSDPPLPGTVPSLPSALQCGSFLKAEKLPFDVKRFSCSSIPAAPASLSQEDLLLLGESGRTPARSISLKEKSVLDLEENSRRGLMAISAMDSFLAGLIKTVKEDVDGDEAPSFSLRDEIDEDDLYSFLTAVSSCLSYTAGTLASIHTNVVLARRDAILDESQALKKSSVTKNSLRAIPLSADSLFGGGHVSSTLHSLAETRRDLVLTNPRPAPKGAGSSYPIKGGSKHPPQTSQNRGKKKIFAKSKGQAKNAGKPYERSQTSKSGAKPSPQ